MRCKPTMKSERTPLPTETSSEYPMPRSGAGWLVLQRWQWSSIALAFTSGVLLALASAYAPLFMLAWVGWVPLLLAIRKANLPQSYWLGVVAGIGFYAVATHWVTEFLMTLKGYGEIQSTMLALLYWVYSAQVVGGIAVLYTWMRRIAPVAALASFPVILVVAYHAFPTLFTLRLGEAQSYFLPALQAVEFTGVHGLDLVVALINVVLFASLAHDNQRAERWVVGCATAVIFCWFGYGFYATSQWDHQMTSWSRLRIGIVQPNEKSSLAIAPPQPGYSRAYPPEMAMTKDLAAAGADLALWPEARFKGYFDYEHVQRAFHSEIGSLEMPLLFHDSERVDVDGEQREYNTAAFIDRDGKFAGSYRKIQRIAFGEYLPLVSGVPALQSWVQDYFGFHTISAGSAPAVFRTARFAIVPLICYEAVFPQLVAKSLAGEPAGKLLVILSNDSWFGDTRQPYIHGQISILRAVENRVPLVHVLNNGPTLVVAPNGRILFRSEFQAARGYVVDLPYAPDSGGSFFNRHPYWFIATLYVLLLSIALAMAVSAARARNKAPTEPA